jgi:hypothetical protein
LSKRARSQTPALSRKRNRAIIKSDGDGTDDDEGGDDEGGDDEGDVDEGGEKFVKDLVTVRL